MVTPGSFTHVDVLWEDPAAALMFRRLASFSRLIRFDRLGTGASDPLPLDRLPPWESYADELAVVLDDVGSEGAAILVGGDAGSMALYFAATKPERTSALILFNTTARFLAADDCPIGIPREAAEALVDHVDQLWGTDAMAQLSVPIAHGRYVVEHIPGAKLVELPGSDWALPWEAADLAIDQVEEFLKDLRQPSAPSRVLAAVLFSDVVGSTEQAGRLGDRRWRELLNVHDELGRRLVQEFDGQLVKTSGGVMRQ